MRRLTLTQFVTLDGVVQAPGDPVTLDTVKVSDKY